MSSMIKKNSIVFFFIVQYSLIFASSFWLSGGCIPWFPTSESPGNEKSTIMNAQWGATSAVNEFRFWYSIMAVNMFGALNKMRSAIKTKYRKWII